MNVGRPTSPGAAPSRVTILPVQMHAMTLKTMVTAVLVLVVSWVLLQLAPVALVLVVALFLVGTLNPAVEWLESKRVSRGLSIGVVFFLLLLTMAGLLAITVPALAQQVSALVHAEPALRERLAGYLSQSPATVALSESLRNFQYASLAKESAATAFQYSTAFAAVVAYLVSAVFLALYIMIDRDRLRGGLYAVVPRSHHIRLSRVLLNLEVIVGGYIRGQVMTSALMGAFTFVLLLLCRVKGALAIGVLAGLADVLPYIGVFLSIGPAVGAALSTGPLVAVVVLAAMLAYEEFESRFLVPRIYGNALKLPSSVVLFALLVGGTLMGIPGALLALPVAAAMRMLVEELRVELPGEDVDDSLVRAGDASAEREYEKRAEGVAAEEAAAIAIAIEERRENEAVAKPLP